MDSKRTTTLFVVYMAAILQGVTKFGQINLIVIVPVLQSRPSQSRPKPIPDKTGSRSRPKVVETKFETKTSAFHLIRGKIINLTKF